jgi:hypothetical protein
MLIIGLAAVAAFVVAILVWDCWDVIDGGIPRVLYEGTASVIPSFLQEGDTMKVSIIPSQALAGTPMLWAFVSLEQAKQFGAGCTVGITVMQNRKGELRITRLEVVGSGSQTGPKPHPWILDLPRDKAAW